MRVFIATLLFALGLAAPSSAQDSVFASYEAFEEFVDDGFKSRDFATLTKRLGGRDEYTPEQLTALTNQMRAVLPMDFTDGAVMKEVVLENGFRQEARTYWREGTLQYVYSYFLLQERGDALVVINFNFNTSVAPILASF